MRVNRYFLLGSSIVFAALWTAVAQHAVVSPCAVLSPRPLLLLLLLRGIAWASGESPYRFEALVPRGTRVEK